jgi:galactokinase/mevalonate kinase-like predicted kinase
MAINLSVPARVNLLGNPSDGNEGAHACISAAVDLRAHAVIDPHERYILEISSNDSSPTDFNSSEIPIPYQGHNDLLIASINRLYLSSQEFQTNILRQGFHLRVSTNVPRQSGLGGSSLFVLLTLAAMREYYELDRRIHNDYFLSELAQRIEEVELGITCGFADRYIPLFGGLAYVDYHSKLRHEKIGDEPYATYERLDHFVESLPLVGVMTGLVHDSGDCAWPHAPSLPGSICALAAIRWRDAANGLLNGCCMGMRLAGKNRLAEWRSRMFWTTYE